MEVKNCRICKRLFNYLGGPNICPECREKQEEQFNVVKEYIRDHPKVSMAQVSEETEVSVPQIKEWVREGRLEFTKGVGGIVCEKCGAPISTGRFCDNCKAEMAEGLTSAFQKDKPAPEIRKKPAEKGAKMRFRR